MNRRGMVATLDAMIFVTVLAVVSMTLFFAGPQEDGSPDASEICDSVSSITLPADCVAEDSGNMRLNIWDIAAVSMEEGDTEFIDGYLEDVLDDMLTGRYGYEMTLIYEDSEISFGRGGGAPLSECSREISVLGGGTVSVRLTIYA